MKNFFNVACAALIISQEVLQILRNNDEELSWILRIQESIRDQMSKVAQGKIKADATSIEELFQDLKKVLKALQ